PAGRRRAGRARPRRDPPGPAAALLPADRRRRARPGERGVPAGSQPARGAQRVTGPGTATGASGRIGMTRLERRYRRLLRLLPGWYRADREDEMVATFLADRDDDLGLEYGWPGWREAWAVAVLAVRIRQRADAPPRSAMIGDALRLVALGGLLAGAAAHAGWLAVMLAVPVPVPDGAV